MSAQSRSFKIRTRAGQTLSLLNQAATGSVRPAPKSVLYIHGATFPSRLSVAFKFEGYSWMDDLAAAGFNVWALDFLGFGESDRHIPIAGNTDPYCRTSEAAEQIGHAVEFILDHDGIERLSLIAHSWGTMPAGKFAGSQASLVDSLVLFGPIAQRHGPADIEPLPPIRQVTVAQQYQRFVGDVPNGHPAVLESDHFPQWGEAYLDSDPASRARDPHAVGVPSGPVADIRAAWSGNLPYDPARITAPTLIIRGQWDSLCDDTDARWLFDALRACKTKRDIKIPKATHLMHLEQDRFALYRETRSFLTSQKPAFRPSATLAR